VFLKELPEGGHRNVEGVLPPFFDRNLQVLVRFVPLRAILVRRISTVRTIPV
jgi:hypothetical protein